VALVFVCVNWAGLCQAETAAPGEAYAELEKALPKLLAAADDPHFKVCHQGTDARNHCQLTACENAPWSFSWANWLLAFSCMPCRLIQ